MLEVFDDLSAPSLKSEKSLELNLVIDLPKNNPERVGKLTAKLEKYHERLDKQKLKYSESNTGDYMFLPDVQDTIYKIAILSKLLTDGQVDVEKLAKDLSSIHGSINKELLDRAGMVIFDYVMTGGNFSKSNMGLKK